MKKFTSLFLTFLCLSLNIIKITPAAATGKPIITQGVYISSDLNISPLFPYTVQNTSPTDRVYIEIFDENEIMMQCIRLIDDETIFPLVPIMLDYRIVVIGKGSVLIRKGERYIIPVSPKNKERKSQ